MGSISKARRRSLSASVVAMLVAAAASAQTGQPGQTGSPPSGPQTEKPQAPETAPAKPPPASPVPAFVALGPAREIKLSENTWFRFGAQVQAWARYAQDRIIQAGGGDGGYAFDYYCRRCRFFATGSVVRDVYFNVLFEASNLGRADPITGTKSFAAPSILDAYAQVKFADWFWLSGGSILLPLTRNGTQPTTTYLSIDNANVDTTPILQGNTNVIRDLGFQANGFFLANHLEYRVGVFQGTRAGAKFTGTLSATGACNPPTCILSSSAGHNPPRFVSMLSFNFWDTETGYVNGGHYFGAKRVLGVMANFDYQTLRNQDPPLPGTSKNAYYGVSAAAFINLPMSGSPNPRGGDELVGLFQWGLYDGGLRQSGAVPTNVGTYPNVLKQYNILAEAAYYSLGLKTSVFGKFEMRKVSDSYSTAIRQANNVMWIAGGLKYYVAPANLLNFALQYERIQFNDAPATAQGGTNNVTFQMQMLLY
jgi:hypothetical protein